MKKTVLRIISGLCTLAMVGIMLIALSACSTDIITYQTAVDLIAEAEQTQSRTESIAKYEEAIETLETIPDHSETSTTLNNAKIAHDKLVIEEVKYCYHSDYFEIDNWLSKMYDQKKAESVTVWMDYSQEIVLGYYNAMVNVIKSNLKDPNSFKDVGSSYTYTAKVGTEENAIVVHELTYKIDYTATNSFGGTVRDQFEYTFEDVKYTFDSNHLSSQEVANVVQYVSFEDMCNSLLK